VGVGGDVWGKGQIWEGEGREVWGRGRRELYEMGGEVRACEKKAATSFTCQTPIISRKSPIGSAANGGNKDNRDLRTGNSSPGRQVDKRSETQTGIRMLS